MHCNELRKHWRVLVLSLLHLIVAVGHFRRYVNRGRYLFAEKVIIIDEIHEVCGTTNTKKECPSNHLPLYRLPLATQTLPIQLPLLKVRRVCLLVVVVVLALVMEL